MKEIALHLLDIVQNSVRAGASHVDISFILGEDRVLAMTVKDDGCGMSPELLERVRSPFTTTRTTRKVGLGIPLLQQNAMLTGGEVTLESEVGRGTVITATFHTDSIDCLPLGDLASTMASIVMGSPDRPEFSLTCKSPSGEMSFSTEEIRAVLGQEVSLAEPRQHPRKIAPQLQTVPAEGQALRLLPEFQARLRAPRLEALHLVFAAHSSTLISFTRSCIHMPLRTSRIPTTALIVSRPFTVK